MRARETDIQTDRQTETDRDRERQRETESERQRQTQRDTERQRQRDGETERQNQRDTKQTYKSHSGQREKKGCLEHRDSVESGTGHTSYLTLVWDTICFIACGDVTSLSTFSYISFHEIVTDIKFLKRH